MLFFITSKVYKLLYTDQTFKKCQHLTVNGPISAHSMHSQHKSCNFSRQQSEQIEKYIFFACPVKLSKSCSLHLHIRIFQPVHVRRSFSLRRSPAASQRKSCCRNQTAVLQIYSKRQYAQSLKK